MRIHITRMTSPGESEDIEFHTQGEVDVKLLAKALGLGRELKPEFTAGMRGEEYRRYDKGSIFTDPQRGEHQ